MRDYHGIGILLQARRHFVHAFFKLISFEENVYSNLLHQMRIVNYYKILSGQYPVGTQTKPFLYYSSTQTTIVRCTLFCISKLSS